MSNALKKYAQSIKIFEKRAILSMFMVGNNIIYAYQQNAENLSLCVPSLALRLHWPYAVPGTGSQCTAWLISTFGFLTAYRMEGWV